MSDNMERMSESREWMGCYVLHVSLGRLIVIDNWVKGRLDLLIRIADFHLTWRQDMALRRIHCEQNDYYFGVSTPFMFPWARSWGKSQSSEHEALGPRLNYFSGTAWRHAPTIVREYKFPSPPMVPSQKMSSHAVHPVGRHWPCSQLAGLSRLLRNHDWPTWDSQSSLRKEKLNFEKWVAPPLGFNDPRSCYDESLFQMLDYWVYFAEIFFSEPLYCLTVCPRNFLLLCWPRFQSPEMMNEPL